MHSRDSRGKEKPLEPTQRGESDIVARHPFDRRVDLVGETWELGDHADNECCDCSSVDACCVPVEASGFVKLVDIVATGPSHQEEVA